MLNNYLLPKRQSRRAIKNKKNNVKIRPNKLFIALLFSCHKTTKFLVLAVLKYYNLFVPKVNQY